MSRTAPEGLITTLYSFKGGVGRTMAAANVAFTAAMNGLSVLVMDWDLEAPGMAYYFRGLGDPEQSRAIKCAPGVMDLVWAWRNEVGLASDDTDVSALLARYESGAPFLDCIRPVLSEEQLPPGGRLDILGAGSRQIDEDNSYAEALARFSWPDFFDESFGGLFIDRLRTWAKAHYDIVLVDSRTGYADVASVCTVQLPDVVALAFIYNRQNIEGVANVAGSIAAQRGEDVRLRAIPMRLSRENTLDEAEARSRAVRHLTRNGAFTDEAVKADLDRLPIRTASLPFYETIAAFMPPSSSSELLTLDYKRLAEALCQRTMTMPVIDETWREAVARRLEPRTATIEYLHDLRGADGVRAAEELDRLLDGALESELHDDRLDHDYVEALIRTGLDLADNLFDEISMENAIALGEKAVRVARSEYEHDPTVWAVIYVEALMDFQDRFAPPASPEERSEMLLEYDGILEAGTPTGNVLLRRARIRRELVAMRRNGGTTDGFARIEEAMELLERVAEGELATDVHLETAALLFQKARLQHAEEDRQEAFATAEAALIRLLQIPPFERSRIGRLLPDVHLLMAHLSPDKERAADHVLAAAEQSTLLSPLLADLSLASGILLKSDRAAQRTLDLISKLTATSMVRGAHSPAYYFSRSPIMASQLAKASTRLLAALSDLETDEAAGAREALIRTNVTTLDLLKRRPIFISPAARQRDVFKLIADATGLAQMAAEASPQPNGLEDLIRAASSLDALANDPGDRS